MSMLAEPRRKQRISVDPQNLQWGEDESRVGKRMMEKMGWRGGGLGREESGAKDNIRLRANYTQRGLGVDKSAANAGHWVAHHDEFARILAELNEKKKGKREADDDAEKSEEETGQQDKASLPASIEERSRRSKARIHYHRYVRSKDVSGYTDEQKSAIFGKCPQKAIEPSEHVLEEQQEAEKAEGKKRKKNKRNKDEEANEEEIKKEETNDECSSSMAKIAPVTMDQYFARKMMEMAKKRAATTTSMGDEEEEIQMECHAEIGRKEEGREEKKRWKKQQKKREMPVEE